MAQPSKIDTLQKIELAEGVQILLRPAGPGARMQAWLIDLLYFILIMSCLGFIASLIGEFLGSGVSRGLMSLAAFLVNWFYFVIYEVQRGASPGKKAMRLRVVRTSGAAVTWGPSMLRNLLRFADFLPFGYLFGVVTCLSNRNFQRLGDLVADTVVIHDGVEIRDVSAPLRQPVVPIAPTVVFNREEQLALIQFVERGGLWSTSRIEELAAYLEPITGATGRDGALQVLGMGAWLRDS